MNLETIDNRFFLAIPNQARAVKAREIHSLYPKEPSCPVRQETPFLGRLAVFRFESEPPAGQHAGLSHSLTSVRGLVLTHGGRCTLAIPETNLAILLCVGEAFTFLFPCYEEKLCHSFVIKASCRRVAVKESNVCCTRAKAWEMRLRHMRPPEHGSLPTIDRTRDRRPTGAAERCVKDSFQSSTVARWRRWFVLCAHETEVFFYGRILNAREISHQVTGKSR